ncbi:MAG: diaminopimelate dehydrogenase [Clostridiales bacterium]|jgi:diaminopimelate dehydrogenase|nr:diaminopimelate dehydrogenase [Clostridiales bacterium]
MDKIRVAVVGYGNIGKCAVEAVAAATDMELVGVVRSVSTESIYGIKVVTDIKELGNVDAALLCTPTRLVPEYAAKYLNMGINTVDSFDIHGQIFGLRGTLDEIAKKNNAAAIISAGWDPGSDSVVRALLEACAPKGITYTNFGPGMSMGHTVAVKAKKGVKNALSLTIPTGTGIHRRMVYVETLPNADFNEIKKSILEDDYFINDETHIVQVDNADKYIDKGHGVNMQRSGASGTTHNQFFEFNMRVNNPALTSQVMVACARASMKQKPGAYTMIEIPVIDLLEGGREEIIRGLV